MNAIRALLGLSALTIGAALALDRLDTATLEQRRAAAESVALQAVYAMLPAELRTSQVRLERRPAAPAHGVRAPWVLARGSDGNVVAFLTLGTAIGYGGELAMQVVSAPDGQVLRTRLDSHHETPAYTGDLRARWQAVSASALGGQIAADQLSGATVSARAIQTAIADALTQARAAAGLAAEKTP